MSAQPGLSRCFTLVREMPEPRSPTQRAMVLGRTGGKYEIASIAPALRSCFQEYGVPNLNRRSHGVFVSEMPQETEEEEEIDEEISIEDLDDVEKSLMKMTTATLFWRKAKSERCWRRRGNKKRQEISKERPRRGFGKPPKPATTPVTRKFRAEVEELNLTTKCNRCGNVGHWAGECPQKSSERYKGGGKRNQQWKKNEHFVKKTERCVCLRLEH